MRDPHVQAMHYKVGSGGGVSYLNPVPISFSNHLGTFDLSDGKLRIVPSEHFPDERSSCRAIQPFLEEWEMDVHLTSNIPMLRFEFDRVELIDRAPPPPPPPPPPGVNSGAASTAQARSVSLGARSMAVLHGRASPHFTCSKYPQPPMTFRATTDVQLAYRRWLKYLSGEESLQSMAYFVLKLLEGAAGGREGAAVSFQIDKKVLGTIGELSSTKGNESTARKPPGPGRQFQDVSGAEKQWLEKAVRRLIQRQGEHAHGGPLAKISLRDLPSL